MADSDSAVEDSGSRSTGLALVDRIDSLRAYDWYPLRPTVLELFPVIKPHLIKDTFEPLATELVGHQWGDVSEALRKRPGYNNKEVYHGHWRLVREFARREGKVDIVEALTMIHGGAGASAVIGGPVPTPAEVVGQHQGLLGTPGGMPSTGMMGPGAQAVPAGQEPQRVLRHDLSQLASAMAQDPVITSVLPLVQHATRLHMHRYMETCAFHGRDPVPLPQCQAGPVIFGEPAAPVVPDRYAAQQACPSDMETDDVVDDIKPAPVEVLGFFKELPLGAAGETYGCGVATAVGYKGKGEDRHLVVSFGLENGPLNGTKITLLAVCDGHGGAITVDKLHARLQGAYKTALEGMATEAFQAELLRVVTSAYDALDRAMCSESRDFNCGGSTAVVALIIHGRIYVINLGDSLGLVYLRDGTFQSTRAHNRYTYDEAVRVAKAGGVVNGRVAGSLMGTRAFGDFHGKGVAYASGDDSPPLLTVPEILSFALADVDHLVLASDGVLDRAQEEAKGWLPSEDADLGAFAWELRTAGAGARLQIAWEGRCGRQGVLLNGLARLIKLMLVEADRDSASAAAEHVLQQCMGLSKPDDITVVYLRLTEPLATTSV